MKGPNGKSVILNRATVSISATVYDRRALDCTDDKALVNSLNHLTFLASTSIKVRDAMINDGAIERLVDILYECKDPKTQTDNVLFAWKWVLSLQCLVLAGTRGSENMRKKLVYAGIIPVLATILDNHFLTRKNSSKSSNELSALPTNTTTSQDIGSNSTNTSNSTDSNTSINSDHNNNNNNNNSSNSNNGNDNDNNSNDASSNNNNRNTINNATITTTTSTTNTSANSNINNIDDSNSTVFSNSNDNNILINNNDNEDDTISNVFRNVRSVVNQANESILDAENEFDKILNNKTNNFINLNSNLSLGQEELELLNLIELAKCFQKLSLQNTENDLLNFNKTFKEVLNDPILSNEFTQRLETCNILKPNTDPFNNKINLIHLNHTTPRSFENGLILPSTDDVIWSLQLLAFISKYTYLKPSLTDTYLINGLSFRSRNHPPPLETDSTSIDLDDAMVDANDNENENENENSNLIINLLDPNACLKLKQTARLNRLNELSDEFDYDIISDYFKILSTENKIEKFKYFERIRLNSTRMKQESLGRLRIKSRKNYKEKLLDYSNKWDYDNSWDLFENLKPIDKDIIPFANFNLFPLIERFSVKLWFQEDICYWAAVVVRNANRKDERMNGRRQCANFNCGKWEDHPKQFSKCRRCKRAKYCSRDCQTKSWIFHKHWCIPAINPQNQTNQQQGQQQNQQPNGQPHHHHQHQHQQGQTQQQHGHHEHNRDDGDLTLTPTPTADTANTTISSIGPRTIPTTAASESFTAEVEEDEDI